MRFPKLCLVVLGAMAIVGWHGAARAMPANPNALQVKQPDGTPIALRMHGDEHFNWQSDAEDFPVDRKPDGVYVYIAPADAPAAPGMPGGGRTDLVVGKSDPAAAGIKKGMPPRPEALGLMRPDLAVAPAGAEPLKRVAPSGDVKNVVILMKFANHGTRTVPSVADVDKLFNAVGGDPAIAPTGSVRDIYLANSYGAFKLNSTVFAWVTLPKTEAYYADNNSGLTSKIQEAIKDALVLADPLINFADYDKDGDGFIDAIAFLHSGYGAEWGGADSDGADYKNRIWSHRWAIPTWTSADGVKVSGYHISPALWGTSGSAPGRIGVICHETGHFFGMPDLYDGGGGSGIGSWCMMANSWGFDSSQLYPPNFSAYCKVKLGWVTPTDITAAGTYTAPAAETSSTIFKVTAGYPANEYLLIENRQPVGSDQKIPAGSDGVKGGLAVWHIDENKGTNTDPGFPGQAGYPANNKHYMVALLQADGNFNLEHGAGRGDGDDVYRAGFKSEISHTTVPNTDAYQNGTIVNTDNTIYDISASSASMTFKYSVGPPPPATTGGRMAFAWADQPTTTSYQPAFRYAHNPTGGPITITRTGVGAYNVTFSGMGGNGSPGGHVQVTAYGPGSETAKIVRWHSIGPDLIVQVRCFNHAGSPVNTRYTIMAMWP